ncbi:uncharacterized protein EAE97_007517 [Botrytis byssoidea]|uniref:Probable beta-glucosidase btgE n=1 Tax=Botrytis byssoidea TaxID=139641 RepID=A0A9P5IFN9_9HELO|nr:uncharacterized protein EAE97_007517 [Botrytis byssoidea]KAF7937721.1 hypothetical protein EAE97_007517 [Botrytis byssoidea]
MKAGVLAVAAAIAGGVNARDLGRRHGHQEFHERGLLATPASSSESCGCTTVWSTVTGEPQLYFPPAPTAASVASSSAAPPAPSTSADACSDKCNTQYNTCRSAPDANRSTCASNYASCLGYSPFDSNGSLVAPTACSSVASTPAASAPGSSAPAPSTSADACSDKCNTQYNTCRSAPDANRSTCASNYASCLGYSPFDSNGSLIAPTACSSSATSSATSAQGVSSVPAASVPGSSAPAPSAPAPSAPAPSAPAPSAPAASAPGSSAPATSKGVSTAPTAPASTAPAVVPTPLATTCPTPGVYTIPATTVTLTESTTVCGATSTGLPSAGTYTVGGVTTVVTTATTVVCPYAAVSTSEGVVTSTILTTTYVCPSAGTYTINPLTTTVTEPAVWVYPTPASYAPGTYTQPEVVTTITETNVVVFCPYSSSYSTIVDATLPAGTPAQATSAPAPVTTSVVVPVATPSSSSVYVAPSSSAASVAPSSSAVSVVPSSSAVSSSVVASSVASPSASSTSASSGNGGSVGSTGKQWAMTYSPYQDSGSCKTAAEVSVDVALIASKGFTAIRIYSTDCSGLENVGNAAKLAGIKMIVGIFISETGCSGAADQVTELIAWGQWSLVELIVVGNEAVFGGHTTASELAAFISSSRSSFASAGYTGQITTTEPLNIWQENTSVLCSAVDITGANLHPFFNAEVTAENAGKFALSQLELADAICPGLTAINLECGWPSAGTCNGAACPGVEEQKTAVSSIIESCGGRAAIFSYTNDLWKQPGGFGCEQSWGSIHLF